MSRTWRVLVAVVVRTVVLVGMAEGVAWLYARWYPDDDGLGTGLMVMMVLVTVSGLWGLADGFRRSPVDLCVTWLAVGFACALGLTLSTSLGEDSIDWSVMLQDLTTGLVFWAALEFVPAIVCGIVPATARHSDEVSTRP